MRLYDRAGNSKSESGTTGPAVPGGVDAIEAIEDALQILTLDTGACVADVDTCLAIVGEVSS